MGKKQSKLSNAVNNDYVYNGPPIPDLNHPASSVCAATTTMTPPTSVTVDIGYEASKQSSNTHNLNLFRDRDRDHVFAHNALYTYTSLRELTNVIILGFVRSHCCIAVSAAPQDVIDLCLLFYSVGDEWDKATSDTRLVHDEGQVTIGKPVDSATITRYYAFGRDTVIRGQKRLWRFKVVQKDKSYSRLSIGLGVIPRDIVNVESWDNEYNNDYVYDQNRYKLLFKNGKISNGKWVKPYCDPIAVNDIIEMELDMQQQTDQRIEPGGIARSSLGFWINGIYKGIAFSDISTRKSWTLCASFQRRDKLSIIPIFSSRRQRTDVV
uniref:Uncharacterized protein n=1 Tax=Elphidium margaritaceum TaxID=933848 RepID=A0A7S0XMN4_9EUKA|mmetsp:Transcript_1619/g.3132  ORF Transcript_1619/g.3132 Transcript_1619/m.3132 type:complete len:323 (+) Transcript_1619:115-1083(+)